MLVTNSGSPFNITVGQDLNGDNQFNDRPAFATSASTDTLQTSYGTFDLNPSSGEARIPYNYGTGPGQFSMNMRMSKSIRHRTKVWSAATPAAHSEVPAADHLQAAAPVVEALPAAASAPAVSAAAAAHHGLTRRQRADIR